MSLTITWVLEAEAFDDEEQALKEAAEAAGHRVKMWSDDWLETGRWPTLSAGPVVFHGSLGNASRIAAEAPWTPGAFCRTRAFCCSAWYPRARPWLLNEPWHTLSVRELVEDPAAALDRIGASGRFFVRPDSPLKPFSGRVLDAASVSYEALDHGFYYDDVETPALIAPAREVGREWRLVVVDGAVVAGCQYTASSRAALDAELEPQVAELGAAIAQALEPPEPVYVADICEADDGLRLLELNPFSGADLYACERSAVVRAVAAHLEH